MKTAKSSDLKTQALPAARTTLGLDRDFFREEMVLIRRGFIPRQMEDKWFIYWTNDTLFFHRSWTGFCIYVVFFKAEGDGYRITKTEVNRDLDQYRETSDRNDIDMLGYLIDVLLLHKDVEFPDHDDQALSECSPVNRAMPSQHPTSSDLKACIHRGADQIGGTCVQLECEGRCLILDVGVPLDADDPAEVELPGAPGLSSPDTSLLGIVISHPHQDHYGLASRLPKDTLFLMGAATERILAAAAEFTPSGGTFEHVWHLQDRTPVELGPFRITPYLMDHSAYDAYAILVEAGGKKLFYTGDLRGHGRKGNLFERLLKEPPEDVDILLMEGTTLTREGTEEGFPTESDLESEMVEIFTTTQGMPLVWCSGQNIDRLVTVFRAAKRSGRQFIMDMYTAHVLASTKNPRLPQAGWAETRVYLPWSQKRRIIQDQSFEIANRYKLDRIYPEQLADAAARSVMLFRPSMRRDLEKAGCLEGACLVYSMWNGYLAEEGPRRILNWLTDRGLPLHKCHTSGHASVKDLQRLRKVFPRAVAVPVHTQQPHLYENTFGNVIVHPDGEWWSVGK